jgi:PTH2 family peptidyl-tRNA hydrolase
MAGFAEEIKQVIIVRKDIKMGTGKLAAQVGHAAVMSYLETTKVNNKIAEEWLNTGGKKIVLKVENEESLRKLFGAFKYKKIPCALITDAGLTQLPPGTVTALGVGPWATRELNPLTSMLKLL